MTTPTLELHITATGIQQVADLRAALAGLNSEAAQLRNIGASTSALDQLAAEMKSMREDVVSVMKDVKAALVDGLKGTLQQAVQTVNSGSNDLISAFNSKMKSIADGIAKGNEEAAKRLVEVNGATVAQAKVAGANVGKAYAESEQEAVAKVRVSYSVPLAGGARASIGASGLSNADLVMQEAKNVEQSTLALSAAYDKALAVLDKQVTQVIEAATVGPNTMRTKGYIAWWDSVISDMEKAETAMALEYAKTIKLLEKQTAAVMKAATEPAYLPAGAAWWDKQLAQMEEAQALLDAAYAKEIVQLEKQTASVMKAATEPAYLAAGPSWWESQLVQMEEAQAKLDAAYAKEIVQLEKQTASVMRAATQPSYLNAGPKWWDAVIAEWDAAEAKLAAQAAKEIAALEKQTAAVMKAATVPAYQPADAAWWDQIVSSEKKAVASLGDASAWGNVSNGLRQYRSSLSGASEEMKLFSYNQRVLREGSTTFTELLRQNFLRAAGSMTSLLNAAGFFLPVFTAVGAVVAAAAVAVGIFALAAYKGEEDVTNFNKAMIATGGYMGLLKGDMDDLAKNIAGSTNVSIATAREALMDMAKSGAFTGDAMKVLGQDIVLQSQVTGESLQSVVQDYAKLQDGVYKWAEEHNKSMHFMSDAQLQHVRLLEEEGNKQQAMIEVGNAVNESLKSQTEVLGPLESAWHRLSRAISDAWTNFKDGMATGPKGLQAQLDAVQKQIDERGTGLSKFLRIGQGDLPDLLAQKAALQNDILLAQQAAEDKANTARIQAEGAEGTNALAGMDLKINKLAKVSAAVEQLTGFIEKNNRAWLSDPRNDQNKVWDPVTRTGAVSDAQKAQMIGEIKAKYGPKGGVGSYSSDISAITKEFQTDEQTITTGFQDEKKLYAENYQNKLVDQGTYLARSRALTQTYSDDLMDDFATSADKYQAQLQKDISAVQSSNATPTAKKAKINELEQAFDTWYYSQWAKIDDLTHKASTSDDTVVDKAVGNMNKLTQSNVDYWSKAEQSVQKQADQAKVARDLASATDEVRAKTEAEMKVQDSHSAYMQKLQNDYDLSVISLQHYIASIGDINEMTPTQLSDYQKLAATTQGYSDAIAYANVQLDKMKQQAGVAALDQLADKKLQTMRTQAQTLANQVDKSIVDAMLTGGTAGVQKLKDAVKQAFLAPIRVVLQAIVQPIANGLVNMGYSMLGLGNATPSSGLLGNLNSASSAYNMASSGSSLYSIGSQYAAGTMSGANAAGTIYANATGSGLDGLLATNGAYGTAAGASAVGAGAGSAFATGGAAEGAFGVGAGATGAADLAAGSAVAEGSSGAMAAAGTASAIPVAGWIAAAAIIAYALFAGKGGGPKTGGYYGALNSQDNSTGNYVGMENTSAAVTGMQTAVDTLNTTYQNYLTSVGGSGSATFGMGMSMDPQGSSNSFVEGVTRDANGNVVYDNVNKNVGRNQSDVDTEIKVQGERAVLAALQTSDLPSKVKDYLAKLDPMTASSADIEKSLAITQAVGQLDKALIALSPDFTKVTALSIDGENALIGYAGGLSNFTSAINSYYTNFYSQAEQTSATWSDLQRQFSALNVAMPTTRDGFRALVNSVDVSTDSGKKLYTSLINLSGEFANVTKSAQDTQTALTQGVSDATTKLTDAYNAEKDALTQTHDKFTAFITSFKDFMKQLTTGTLSGLTPQQQYDATRSKFQQDLSDLNSTNSTTRDAALTALQQDSTDFLTASQAFYGASQGYFDDLNQVKAAVDSAQQISQSQADLAQMQLDDLDQMVSGLITLNTTVQASMANVVEAIQELAAAQLALAAVTNPVVTPTTTTAMSSTTFSAASSALVADLSSLGTTSGTGTSPLASLLNSLGIKTTPLATGMDRVPHDGFLATLHADEAVLNRDAASAWRAGGTGGSDGSEPLMRALIARVASLEQTVGAGLAGVVQATDRNANTVVKGTQDSASKASWAVRTKDKAAIK